VAARRREEFCLGLSRGLGGLGFGHTENLAVRGISGTISVLLFGERKGDLSRMSLHHHCTDVFVFERPDRPGATSELDWKLGYMASLRLLI
jgi:hypothetical protein